MTLTVEFPNDFATHADPAREALEAVAVEAYRTDALTRSDAAALLGVGRLAFQDILLSHGVLKDAYTLEALEQDIKTGDAMREAGLIPYDRRR